MNEQGNKHLSAIWVTDILGSGLKSRGQLNVIYKKPTTSSCPYLDKVEFFQHII